MIKLRFYKDYLKEKQLAHQLVSLLNIRMKNQRTTITSKMFLDHHMQTMFMKKSMEIETIEEEEEVLPGKLLVGW